MLPGYALDPARLGVGLVTADHQPAGLLAPVDQVIRVAETGGVVGEFVARDGFQGDVLVVYRGGGQVQAGKSRHARSPQPGGVDHVLAADGAPVGLDGGYLSLGREADAGGARISI